MCSADEFSWIERLLESQYQLFRHRHRDVLGQHLD